MRIDLHIEAVDGGELRAALQSMLLAVTPATTIEKDADTAPAEVKQPTDIAAPAQPKKTRTTKRPEPVGEVTDIAAETKATAPATEAAQPTVEDVRTAIKALMAATDENTTFKLIEKHGGKSASTLHAAGVGAAFIAEATTLTEAAKAKA